MSEAPKSFTFFVQRTPWTDFFTIHLIDLKTGKPNGQSEELDVDETVQWFLDRGANEELLHKGLDHIWNFAKGAIEIDAAAYKEPPVKNAALKPNID